MKDIKIFIPYNYNKRKLMFKGIHKYGEYLELTLYIKRPLFFGYKKGLTLKIVFEDAHSYPFLKPLKIDPINSFLSYGDNEKNINGSFNNYLIKILTFSDYFNRGIKLKDALYTYNPKYENRERRLKKILTKVE